MRGIELSGLPAQTASRWGVFPLNDMNRILLVDGDFSWRTEVEASLSFTVQFGLVNTRRGAFLAGGKITIKNNWTFFSQRNAWQVYPSGQVKFLNQMLTP